MNWIYLNSLLQLNDIKELSRSKAQVIFKHSTRCSVSTLIKDRIERNEQPGSTDFYLLDLLKFRSLSNKIAEDFSVTHESPQLLLIINKECVYEESHYGIDLTELARQLRIYSIYL